MSENENPTNPDVLKEAMQQHATAQAKEKRDFFAISAASGILGHHGTTIDPKAIAIHAYAIADAMLIAGNT
jgi:hypothetical protein